VPVLSYEHPRGCKREGSYEVLNGRIEVDTEFGTRAARLEETSPEVLARMIARELAREAAARQGGRRLMA
jgi:hypothetical protein